MTATLLFLVLFYFILLNCFQIVYHDSKSDLYHFGRNDISYEVDISYEAASSLHFYDDEIRHAHS